MWFALQRQLPWIKTNHTTDRIQPDLFCQILELPLIFFFLNVPKADKAPVAASLKENTSLFEFSLDTASIFTDKYYLSLIQVQE